MDYESHPHVSNLPSVPSPLHCHCDNKIVRSFQIRTRFEMLHRDEIKSKRKNRRSHSYPSLGVEQVTLTPKDFDQNNTSWVVVCTATIFEEQEHEPTQVLEERGCQTDPVDQKEKTMEMRNQTDTKDMLSKVQVQTSLIHETSPEVKTVSDTSVCLEDKDIWPGYYDCTSDQDVADPEIELLSSRELSAESMPHGLVIL